MAAALNIRSELDGPQAARAGSATVLLVEDHPLVREVVARALKQVGHVVLQAGSGEDALALAGRHTGRIDLLLTDIFLPGMRGYELADRLLASRPTLRVLYVSGSPAENVDGGVLKDGDHYLNKPFLPRVLVQRVREALEH